MGCRKISSSPAASVESDPNLLTVHCDAFKGISLSHHLFVTNQSNEHTLLLFLIQCIILSFMACDTPQIHHTILLLYVMRYKTSSTVQYVGRDVAGAGRDAGVDLWNFLWLYH